MNKVVLVSIVILSLFFFSCASKITFKVDRSIDQEKYIQESNNKIPDSSSILFVGAFANKETGYFIKYLEENLSKKEHFNVINSENISEKYPSYPCNVVSSEIESERDNIEIAPGYERNDNKKIEEIGKAINADYVFMAYMEKVDDHTALVGHSLVFGSKYLTGLFFKVKGTLWDISGNKAIGQSYYFIYGSKKMKSGLLADNIYSKTEELIEEISKKAAADISKRIIRENK